MSPSNRAKIGAYFMVGVVSLLLFISGNQLPGPWMRILTAAPLAMTLIFTAYDRGMWRWPGLVRLAGRPSLVGTWCGSLTAYRFDGLERRPVKTEIDIALSIAQTYLSTSVVLMTHQSSSRSVTAEFVKRAEEPNCYTFYYTYENTPKLEHRDHLVVHRGTTAGTVHGPCPLELEAEYWTNRDTKGVLHVRRVSTRRAKTLQEAEQMRDSAKEVHRD